MAVVILSFLVGLLTCTTMVLCWRVKELHEFYSTQLGSLRKMLEITNERITAVEDRQDVQAESIQNCKDALNL